MKLTLREIVQKREGIDYLNISRYSIKAIGRKLTPGFGKPFMTPVGKMGSMRSAMEYILNPNYTHAMATKKKLTSAEIKSINTNEVRHVPNFNAILVKLIDKRLTSDDILFEEFMELPKDMIFVSYNIKKKDDSKILVENNYLEIYVEILNKLFAIYKDEHANVASEVNALVEEMKTDRKISIYTGIPNNMLVESEM